MRKSPIKHRVRKYTRKGKVIDSYVRGKGSSSSKLANPNLGKRKLSKLELAIQRQAEEMKNTKLTKGAEEMKKWFEGWENHIKGQIKKINIDDVKTIPINDLKRIKEVKLEPIEQRGIMTIVKVYSGKKPIFLNLVDTHALSRINFKLIGKMKDKYKRS